MLLLALCGLFKDVISGRPSFPRYPGTGPYGVVLGESYVGSSAPLDALLSSFLPHGCAGRVPRLRVSELLDYWRRRHVVARGEVGRALLRGPSAARARLEGPVGKMLGKVFVGRVEMGRKLSITFKIQNPKHTKYGCLLCA